MIGRVVLFALVITSPSHAAIGGFSIRQGIGFNQQRIFEIERNAAPRQLFQTENAADSVEARTIAPNRSLWLHDYLGSRWLMLKYADGTVVSGSPEMWTLGYDWIAGSYGAFVTNATNSTLTRSGSGTTASPYTLGINLSQNNYWLGTQSFKQNLHLTDFGGEDITLAAPVGTEAWTMTLPNSAGTSNYFLQTNGSGTASWGLAVTGATNSSLSLTGSTLGLNLANANSWTARQTFKSIQSDSVLFKATGDAGITTIKARTDLGAGESYTMFLPLSAGTSGQFLGAFGSGLTGWTSAVTNVTTGEGLKRTISGVTYTVGINYANANTWTATQTFPKIVTDTALVKSATCNVQMIAPTTEPGTNVALTLPPDDGDAGEFLQTNGSGVTTWEPAVTGATDGTLVRSGTSTYTLAIDTTRALNWLNNVEVRDTVKMGDGTNYTMTEADGTLHMVGDATVWDDLRVTPGALDRNGTTSDPDYVAYAPGGSGIGIFLLEFAKNDSASFVVQLPHSYKQGSNIYVHIHWTPGSQGNENNGKFVGWKISYSWANIDGTFGAVQTLDLKSECSGVDDRHEMSPDVEISGVSKNVSSMLICNIKRTDTGTDDDWVSETSGQKPMLLEIDFHYEIDTIGSRTRIAK